MCNLELDSPPLYGGGGMTRARAQCSPLYSPIPLFNRCKPLQIGHLAGIAFGYTHLAVYVPSQITLTLTRPPCASPLLDYPPPPHIGEEVQGAGSARGDVYA